MLSGTISVVLAAALLTQGGLALVLLLLLGYVRLPMISRGEVNIRDIALSRDGWPERERKVSNAFDNQFQLPVLLYLGGTLALLLGPTWLEVGLAWVFVATRIVHAVIHTGTNNVIRRFWAYFAGMTVLILLWLDLIVRLAIHAVGGA